MRDQPGLVRSQHRNRERFRPRSAHQRGNFDDCVLGQLRDHTIVLDINDLNIGTPAEQRSQKIERRLALVGTASLHQQIRLVVQLRVAVQLEELALDLHDLLGTAA